MCEHCTSGDALIDAAIAEGRIDASSRETYLQAFEHTPDLVVTTLEAARPDTVRASRNYAASLSDEEDLVYKADAEARFGIPLAEVL